MPDAGLVLRAPFSARLFVTSVMALLLPTFTPLKAVWTVVVVESGLLSRLGFLGPMQTRFTLAVFSGVPVSVLGRWRAS